MSRELHFKDEILNRLAPRANVAQFASFSPALEQRFARVFGLHPNYRFADLPEAAAALLAASAEHLVNVRSFDPHRPKSHEFVQKLATVDDVAGAVRRLGATGLFTIINETIDVNDGGVSGVLLGDV